VKIIVNGETRLVSDDLTLGELLHQLTGTNRGSAAAVDGEVIPRGEWTTFRLQADQAVEVLTAVQGG
jgi:sulfur carrier protein